MSRTLPTVELGATAEAGVSGALAALDRAFEPQEPSQDDAPSTG